MKVVDIASTIAPEAEQPVIGIRPGEKMHEQMIGTEDAHTFAYDGYFKILPAINDWSSDPQRIGNGKKVQSILVIHQTIILNGCLRMNFRHGLILIRVK